MGVQDHEPFVWLSILAEEIGEAARGLLEHKYGDRSLDAYRDEMIHVAAVAVAALECLERGGWSWSSYCAKHKTYSSYGEPCWGCTNPLIVKAFDAGIKRGLESEKGT